MRVPLESLLNPNEESVEPSQLPWAPCNNVACQVAGMHMPNCPAAKAAAVPAAAASALATHAHFLTYSRLVDATHNVSTYVETLPTSLNAPEVREKLNMILKHAEGVRKHATRLLEANNV